MNAVTADTPKVITTDEFIATFMKPLEQPILLSPPRLCKTWAAKAREQTDEELIPKRSARLVAKCKSRDPRPEAQARKVMMRRIGLNTETVKPDEATF